MTKVVVIGMGYVGIPAAALFADVPGFEVIGVQRRSKRSGWKIDVLNRGECPIGGDEPGLPELIHRVVVEKRTFRVTDDYTVVKDADAILIDVQTPTDERGIPRYESLKEVSRTIAPFLRKGQLVVIESTVAPGTTDNIVKPILEEGSGMKAGEDFYLAFSYERVMVGRLIHNIQNYPRIIGGINEESTKRAMDLYKHIVKQPLHPTNALTAEVAKTVENAYRDVNIAFANEVALLCESLGIDAYEVRRLVNTLPNDPSNPIANPVRNVHIPGAGVGGHCLPKDSWLLKYGVDSYGRFPLPDVPDVIIDSRRLNDSMPLHVVELLEEALAEKGLPLKGSRIAVLGVAFLENSDDPRNTPTTPLLKALREKGAEVVIHEPLVKDHEYPEPMMRDLYAALSGADAMVIMTRHRDYVEMDLDRAREVMRHPVMVDGRNTFNGDDVIEKGFVYRAVGKGQYRSR
ncbi:MAG: nucleotide sugar dehydrogenase [Thermoplasmata archaeon]|nr:nucleotide sugar dehydrogenase [Thermoplasmata archaeon]